MLAGLNIHANNKPIGDRNHAEGAAHSWPFNQDRVCARGFARGQHTIQNNARHPHNYPSYSEEELDLDEEHGGRPPRRMQQQWFVSSLKSRYSSIQWKSTH